MSSVPRVFCTELEYLQREETAEYKSEFYRGEVFAMTGGSPRHNRIALNIATALTIRLRGKPCVPYGGEQRIKIAALGLSTYPDVSVVCEPEQVDAVDKHAIVNPRVLFEVLSPSTEAYNRGNKFRFYRQIPSLEAYVLVSQFEPIVELYVRSANGVWELSELRGTSAVLRLPMLGVEIPLEEIYDRVTFELPAEDNARPRVLSPEPIRPGEFESEG